LIIALIGPFMREFPPLALSIFRSLWLSLTACEEWDKLHPLRGWDKTKYILRKGEQSLI